MTAEVAVVIVTFQPGAEVRGALASVAAELGKVPHELWIVDNASEPSPMEWLRELAPEAKLVRNPANLGFAAANNVALEASRAQAFLMLNPDAELLPGGYATLRVAARAWGWARVRRAVRPARAA